MKFQENIYSKQGRSQDFGSKKETADKIFSKVARISVQSNDI